MSRSQIIHYFTLSADTAFRNFMEICQDNIVDITSSPKNPPFYAFKRQVVQNNLSFAQFLSFSSFQILQNIMASLLNLAFSQNLSFPLLKQD